MEPSTCVRKGSQGVTHPAMKQYHLVYEQSNWTLKQEGQDAPVAVYENQPKGDAIHQAVLEVEREDAVLKIYRQDGLLAEERRFPEEVEAAPRGVAIPLPDIVALVA